MTFRSGLGIWQILSSELITDIIGKSGFDLSILDLEHGLHDHQTVQKCLFAAQSNNLLTIVRVPSINYPYLNQLVDSGVDGILFPHIENTSQIDSLKSNALLYPAGNRSFSPFVHRFSYGKASPAKDHNPNIGILIESLKGIKSSDDLLADSYIDFVYFGAYDISVELSCKGDIFSEPVINQLRELLKLSKHYKKKMLAIYRTLDELKILLELGVQYPIASVDTSKFFNSLNSDVIEYTSIMRDYC
ncbi:aldolase/citrate lyase family protein [Prochlorococcus marinus]|uniref:2,4-dihydroxyhept-2-ene-1,7-dioic acid aldolase n=1 Tax=Prochlorococcus marinus (strain MIT 9211) TaxID=93059 RepID=A9BBL7_PROM4|nr:aldolase/citrate lyase family protein [Prochlorococcus marinus]ABX09229.1 2,4-dihydroxyhept-2-ene-1,7-dioic acid aldolase [Prochlorococcus marinus str. MIT 9211]